MAKSHYTNMHGFSRKQWAIRTFNTASPKPFNRYYGNQLYQPDYFDHLLKCLFKEAIVIDDELHADTDAQPSQDEQMSLSSDLTTGKHSNKPLAILQMVINCLHQSG